MNQQRPAPTNGRAVQAMPPPLPPTNFVLLPHHLQLLRLISLVFNDYDDRDVPHSFIIYIYRLLLVEIMNVMNLVIPAEVVSLTLMSGSTTSYIPTARGCTWRRCCYQQYGSRRPYYGIQNYCTRALNDLMTTKHILFWAQHTDITSPNRLRVFFQGTSLTRQMFFNSDQLNPT